MVGRSFLKTENLSIILGLQISVSTQTLMYTVVMPSLYVLWIYFFYQILTCALNKKAVMPSYPKSTGSAGEQKLS